MRCGSEIFNFARHEGLIGIDGQEAFRSVDTRDWHAGNDILSFRAAKNLVDILYGEAGLVAHLAVGAVLERIKFRKYNHRDYNLVLFEGEQGIRIMDEDVGVENIYFWSHVNFLFSDKEPRVLCDRARNAGR